MPYRRTVRYASPLVAWHELVLTEPAPDWSTVYRAESPRLLVLGSRWIEVEQRGRRFFCDALTPLALTAETPYRTRQPFVGQRSIVLVFDSGDADALHRAAQVRLSPTAQWRLARCRAALDHGVPDPLGFEEELLMLPLVACQGGAAEAHSDADAQHGSGHVADRTTDRAVERARELLAFDPSSSHSLHEVARAVAVSPFHLTRCFKRTNGIGMHGYRTRLRMGLALSRLGEGENDLTRLALDLGYSSHSHFTAAFGAYFGVSPSRAREQLTQRARIR
jgi:AraC family transcriptional regulator